jgi:DNA-binding MarR family transcriptional regulator/GNAT superfamily N-acetyltransferase
MIKAVPDGAAPALCRCSRKRSRTACFFRPVPARRVAPCPRSPAHVAEFSDYSQRVDVGMIAQVRRFNRTVTRQVGALNDSFLSRDRSLAQARLLWEIGVGGSDVRSLRSRLDLDSGYTSRLLRSLEDSGLVVVEQSATDRRIRRARLTSAGLAEREVLDRRSDEAASAILQPLDPRQRARLVNAMAEVERLLVAGTVQVSIRDPREPDARSCLHAYFDELARRFEDGFDPAASISAADEEMTPPAGLFLIATVQAEPIGCGALKLHGDAPAEIKRMWVSPSARGLGVGRRLLTELETHASHRQVRVVRLETNHALTEAISMYRAAGYREVPAFNDESYAHHWFEKSLSSA